MTDSKSVKPRLLILQILVLFLLIASSIKIDGKAQMTLVSILYKSLCTQELWIYGAHYFSLY